MAFKLSLPKRQSNAWGVEPPAIVTGGGTTAAAEHGRSMGPSRALALVGAVIIFGGLGSYLLFASHADTLALNGQIYYGGTNAIQADGTGKKQLSSSLQQLIGTNDWSFSKDGTKIAAVQLTPTTNADGSRQIVVADADGGNQKVIVPSALVGENGGKIAWSPDGQWLAFGVATYSDTLSGHQGYPYQIGVVHPDGSDYHVIPGLSNDVTTGYSGLSWLTDSQTILFLTDQYGLCQVRLDGSSNGCHLLPKLDGNQFGDSAAQDWGYGGPVVSPNGTKVLLDGITRQTPDGAGYTQETDVYEANTDGTGLQNISNLQGDNAAQDAVWSPDGQMVTFGVEGWSSSDNQTGLYVANADGSGIHKIDSLEGFAVQWQLKQPTEQQPALYRDGNINYSGWIVTPDGRGSGSGLTGGLRSISWDGLQYVTVNGNSLYVGNNNENVGAVVRKAYATGATSLMFDAAWSRPAAGISPKLAFVDMGSASNVTSERIGSVDTTTGAVTYYKVANATGYTNPAYSNNAQIIGFDWSQDDSSIYYAVRDAYASPATLTFCTYTIANQSSSCNATSQIKLGSTTPYGDGYSVHWSPDDTRVTYSYGDGVYVANRDGSAVTKVSSWTESGSLPTTAPAWMPDGQSLVYVAPNAGSEKLMSVNIASKTTSVLNALSDDTIAPNGGTLVVQPLPLTSPETAGPSLVTSTPPTVNFAQVSSVPLSQSNVSVCQSSHDPSGIASIQIYDNGTLLRTVANMSADDKGCFSFSPAEVPYGNNLFSLRIADIYGNVTSWQASTPLNRGSLYNPLTPFRLADTRAGSGQAYAGNTLGTQGTLNVQVAGRGGVPTTGVAAVVLNITEASASAPTYLTVYPTGTSRPNASNVNADPSQIANNQTTVGLGANGQVSVYNNSGNTNVIVDVVGYYSTTGGSFTPIAPVRITDTRGGSGQANAGKTLAAHGGLNVQVAGVAGVPATATGVVVDVTDVNASSSGYLSLYPAGTAMPNSSSLNYYAAQTNTKEVTAKLGSTGAVSVYNGSTGSVDAIIDVVGYYTNDTKGLAYIPISPKRVADTRNSSGAPHAGQHLGPGASLAINAYNDSVGQVDSRAQAIVTNLTIPGSTASNVYATEYPSGSGVPNATSATYTNHGPAFDEATAKLGQNTGLNVFNNAGTTDEIVDALGYYY